MECTGQNAWPLHHVVRPSHGFTGQTTPQEHCRLGRLAGEVIAGGGVNFRLGISVDLFRKPHLQPRGGRLHRCKPDQGRLRKKPSTPSPKTRRKTSASPSSPTAIPAPARFPKSAAARTNPASGNSACNGPKVCSPSPTPPCHFHPTRTVLRSQRKRRPTAAARRAHPAR